MQDDLDAHYLDASIMAAIQIHVQGPLGGDILVFLASLEDIDNAEEILRERTKGFKGSGIDELIICPVCPNLQATIFDPSPHGAHKVILAQRIAETVLTFDGIKYMVDSGFPRMFFYDPSTGLEEPKIVPISKSSADQRA